MDELQDALDLVETALEELYGLGEQLEDKVDEAEAELKNYKKEYEICSDQISELETAKSSLKVAMGK